MGLENLSLFLNSKPHFSHWAGCITRWAFALLRVRLMCFRCSHTSLSGILRNIDISFAERVYSFRRAMIYCLMVCIRDAGTTGFLMFLSDIHQL